MFVTSLPSFSPPSLLNLSLPLNSSHDTAAGPLDTGLRPHHAVHDAHPAGYDHALRIRVYPVPACVRASHNVGSFYLTFLALLVTRSQVILAEKYESFRLRMGLERLALTSHYPPVQHRP